MKTDLVAEDFRSLGLGGCLSKISRNFILGVSEKNSTMVSKKKDWGLST